MHGGLSLMDITAENSWPLSERQMNGHNPVHAARLKVWPTQVGIVAHRFDRQIRNPGPSPAPPHPGRYQRGAADAAEGERVNPEAFSGKTPMVGKLPHQYTSWT